MSPHTKHKRRGNSSLLESFWSVLPAVNFSSPNGVVELQNWRSGDAGDAFVFDDKLLKSNSSWKRFLWVAKLALNVFRDISMLAKTYCNCRGIVEQKCLRSTAECSTRRCGTTTWCRVDFLLYVCMILCLCHHRYLKNGEKKRNSLLKMQKKTNSRKNRISIYKNKSNVYKQSSRFVCCVKWICPNLRRNAGYQNSILPSLVANCAPIECKKSSRAVAVPVRCGRFNFSLCMCVVRNMCNAKNVYFSFCGQVQGEPVCESLASISLLLLLFIIQHTIASAHTFKTHLYTSIGTQSRRCCRRRHRCRRFDTHVLVYIKHK